VAETLSREAANRHLIDLPIAPTYGLLQFGRRRFVSSPAQMEGVHEEEC